MMQSFPGHSSCGTASRFGVVVAAILSFSAGAAGQAVAPEFADDYVAVDLGSVPGLPTPYGGVTFAAGDPDTLLIGGAANQAGGAIYRVAVERGCDGAIVGFVGRAELVAAAPSIDGGLTYGPDGVLFYTTYPSNTVGQIPPGEVAATRIVELGPLGVASSTGTLQFVPAGLPGGGRLKILSYNSSNWYDAAVSADGAGTFDIVDVQPAGNVGGGPEGLVFIGAGSPGFVGPTALISQYSAARVAAFDLDPDGNPVAGSERIFVEGLPGAEGATLDPVTGDFLFSTFNSGNQVLVVRGFTLACPADVAPPDGDGQVDFADLLTVLSSWGEVCTGPDINRSGEVDFDDVLAVIAEWGDC